MISLPVTPVSPSTSSVHSLSSALSRRMHTVYKDPHIHALTHLPARRVTQGTGVQGPESERTHRQGVCTRRTRGTHAARTPTCTNAGALRSSDGPFCTQLVSEFGMNDPKGQLQRPGSPRPRVELDGQTLRRRSVVPSDPCLSAQGGSEEPSHPVSWLPPPASSSLIRQPGPGGSTGPAGGFSPATSERAQELPSLAASLFHK